MGNDPRAEDAHKRGVEDGQKSGCIDQIAHNESKGLPGRNEYDEMYDKGFQYGIDHKPQKDYKP